jgi:hypothetical protein
LVGRDQIAGTKLIPRVLLPRKGVIERDRFSDQFPIPDTAAKHRAATFVGIRCAGMADHQLPRLGFNFDHGPVIPL